MLSLLSARLHATIGGFSTVVLLVILLPDSASRGRRRLLFAVVYFYWLQFIGMDCPTYRQDLITDNVFLPRAI